MAFRGTTPPAFVHRKKIGSYRDACCSRHNWPSALAVQEEMEPQMNADTRA
jgi:hypothetical protein